MVLLRALSWAVKPLYVGGAAVAMAVLMHSILPRLKPGKPRLLAATPALLFFLLAPFVFDLRSELLSRASTAAMLTWLATFKLLLLVLGRGPLTDPSLTLGQFTALLLWPILHKEEVSDNSMPKVVKLQASGGAEGLKQAALERAAWRLPENLIIAVVGAATLVMPWVPLFLKTYSAAFGVCAYCGLWANLAAALVMYFNGLEVAPSWDRPWLQNCLSDFWSRRWNLPAAYTLRSLVFDPIIEGRAVKADKGKAPTKASPTPTHPTPPPSQSTTTTTSTTPTPPPRTSTDEGTGVVPRSNTEVIRDLGRPGRTSTKHSADTGSTDSSGQTEGLTGLSAMDLNGKDEVLGRTERKMSLAMAAAVTAALTGPEPPTPTQIAPGRTSAGGSDAAAGGKLGAQVAAAMARFGAPPHAAEPAGEIQAYEEGPMSGKSDANMRKKSSVHAPVVLRRRTTQTTAFPVLTTRTSTLVSRRTTADSMTWDQELAAQKAVAAAAMHTPTVWDTAENAEVVADEMSTAVDIQKTKEGGLEAAIEVAALADGVLEEVEMEVAGGAEDENWAAEIMVQDLKDSLRLGQTGQGQGPQEMKERGGGAATAGGSLQQHQQGLRRRLRSSSPPAHEAVKEEEEREEEAEGPEKAAEAAPGVPKGKGRKVPASTRLLATAATFAISGIMHEILLLICTGWHAYWPHAGRMTMYFMLQVPLSIAEYELSRALKKAKIEVPDAIAIPVTSLTLQVPGLYLFWSPIFNAATAAMKQH